MLQDLVLKKLVERGIVEAFDSLYNTNQSAIKRMKIRNRLSTFRRKRNRRSPMRYK